MPFDAADLAARLLHRDLTPDRLLKLRRHLARDPWTHAQVMDSSKMTKFLDAIEQHKEGGPDTRAFVHHALVNHPQRELPPLPADIKEKVEAFQKARAANKANR